MAELKIRAWRSDPLRQAGAGQANGPALLGWTISDNRLLFQPEVGFQAGLDTGSAEATVRGFTLAGCRKGQK